MLHAHLDLLEVDLSQVSHLGSDDGAAFFAALLAARPHATRVVVTHARHSHTHSPQLGLAQLLDIRRGEDLDIP
ncbi:hypothetical protein [Streptomyces cupreus]|uniref:Uncharacterized protein n=1 Tax=Streptomyces cupreus TaxID=2759956 RepID=A0A7X1ME39_9ACTN|nr:hypothetical protein [Streptomyces cupreus]MBC2907626.1 hypothetical protein [Streptomyces cupreus]